MTTTITWKNILYFLIILLCLGSCSDKPDETEFKIQGFLKGGEGKDIIFREMTPDEVLFIDTIHLNDEGAFEYKYKMPYESFFLLEVNQKDFLTLLPRYGETIDIEGEYNYLSMSYRVFNSPGSQLLWELNQKNVQGSLLLDSIAKEWEKIKDKPDAKELKHGLDSAYHQMLLDQRKYVVDFIESNKGSLTTLMALYKQFGNIRLIEPRKDFDIYTRVMEGLDSLLPNNPHTQYFKNTYNRMKLKMEVQNQVADANK